MNFRTSFHTAYLHLLLAAVVMAAAAVPARALPADHYAQHSRLSEGRWATVRVSQSGMHLVTDAMLRNLGFSDPSKVRVYGTGGQMVPEGLSSRMADDLPEIPSARTSKGLVFFALDHFSWQAASLYDGYPYEHTINPYSEESVYFLSDRDSASEFAHESMKGNPSSDILDTFTARVVHEQDLDHLGESGRTYLGEDFRSTKSQTVSLPLTGNAGREVNMYLCFAAKVTGGSSRLSFKGNGAAIRGIPADTISGVSSSQYAAFSRSRRTVACSDQKLDLTIEYNYSGALFLARLDFVEAFYTRSLALDGGELHFYGSFRAGQTIRISGCDQETVIWEVTDPARPRIVDFTLQGDKALLSTGTTAYREFVAFNPSRISRSVSAGSAVANQDLHALPAPGMLIISPAEYMEGAKIMADLHTKVDTISTLILEPEKIFDEFSGGKPDVSAFRKLLKMWHDRGGAPRYCLIMGKPSFDNKRVTSDIKNASYRPVVIWQSQSGLSEASSYSSDDYIGMLDDVDPSTFRINRARIHTAVGRLPVKSAEEARATARKIADNATKPSLGAWRNKVMLIADDSDNSAHFNQSQSVYAGMRSEGNGRAYLYDRLYLDSYPLVYSAVGATYPQATERMLANYNEGTALTNYIGHASEVGWGHEHLWEWSQIQAMNNKNLTFIYAATCRFAPWDENGVSAGEHLLLNTEGGVIGMISPSRTVYISQNGTLSTYTSSEWFRRDADGLPQRLGDVFINGKNKYTNDENKLRYAFLGDPALRLNSITHTVSIDSIAGADIAADDDLPEIKGGARMPVSGRILDPAGNLDTGFNGTVSLLLYDAETVIETYGNGATGKKETYNDRKTRLAAVNANVRAGRWKATVNVPLEISNNYVPALISAYAWNDRNQEANGFSESLYLFGFEDNADTDTVGPDIEYLRLNTPEFTDGAIVNTSPMVFARLSDPAGINISDGGVGHKLCLILDDNTFFDDVAQYFTPDSEGAGGSIAYALKDVAPGTHRLTLEAWDNLNNSSRATVNFSVSAAADPYIVSLGTDVNPATSGVNFLLALDQPNTRMKCTISVMDLNGRVVWESESTSLTGSDARISTYWNLCNHAGIRVPRGIYLYKARVETPQGTYSSKTNKLAVTAQ